ncbi:hypothetical protein [Amylolactobacillus amylophilus]|uniref:hypothetical protein n=1 Tax=Amylolactobacillus amylophilus TaxID=1603 RepID=UPI0020920EF1|nr:hypothetical protein [Amylolactobacillus amylophilus]
MIIRPVKPEDVRAITKLNYDELHYDYTVEHTAQMLEEVLARPCSRLMLPRLMASLQAIFNWLNTSA